MHENKHSIVLNNPWRISYSEGVPDICCDVIDAAKKCCGNTKKAMDMALRQISSGEADAMLPLAGPRSQFENLYHILSPDNLCSAHAVEFNAAYLEALFCTSSSLRREVSCLVPFPSTSDK